MKGIDISKFRKNVTKDITGISSGFNDPKHWIDTGSYALNYLITNDFNKGLPLGKITMFSGESGSGKSLVTAGSIAKHAQDAGAFVVVLDSENALDEEWLINAGVDTSEDKIIRFGVTMVDDVAKVISNFVRQYRDDYSDDIENAPRVMFIVDSLGMLLTPTDVDQFEKGDMKGDMGRKAKSLTALLRNLVHVIEPYNIGMVCTNHIYDSQDMFSPEPKVSGGNMVVFAPSISIALSKFKLKEDEEGKKLTGGQVRGIRAKCKVLKSRFSKPFETIELQIPYDTGIDRYSGLFDLFMGMELLEKNGQRYKYVTRNGEEINCFKKEWYTDHEHFDKVIADLQERELIDDEEVDTDENDSGSDENESEASETDEKGSDTSLHTSDDAKEKEKSSG